MQENPFKKDLDAGKTAISVVQWAIVAFDVFSCIMGTHVNTRIAYIVAGIIMTPFFAKFIKSKKAEWNSKNILLSQILISIISLILFTCIFAPLDHKDKTTIPEPTQQQIITEETAIEATEQATEPTTETESETILEATETEAEATTEPETTIPETEVETEPPTEPKKQVGKDIDTLNMFSYNGNVRNDVTGNWRYAVFADAGKNVAEYAVSYYDKYMSGNNTEIHAVINFSDMTTTKIVQAIDPNKLALTVYSYVDGEEHDANLMFSGKVLAYYMVNKETAEITEE